MILIEYIVLYVIFQSPFYDYPDLNINKRNHVLKY